MEKEYFGEWEIEEDWNFCNDWDCHHEFKDGEDVYVHCWSLPDGYPGDCDIYCEKHAEHYYSLYRAKIIVSTKGEKNE